MAHNGLTEERGALRLVERLWRKSRLTVHRHIFTDLRNTFRKSLNTARSEYYRSEISKAGGNMRLICLIADSVLGRKVNRVLPEMADESHSALATRFQQSFKEKIEALCLNRSQLPADDMPTVVSTRFVMFEPASPSDVQKILLASATKSCELDSLPTSHRRSFSSVGPDHQRLAIINRISCTHQARCRCTNFAEGMV